MGKIPQRSKWQPTPVLLPGKPHGQRSLVSYSPWSYKELDTTERLYFHFSFTFHYQINEGSIKTFFCFNFHFFARLVYLDLYLCVCVCVSMCEHPHRWFVLCQLFTCFSYFYCSVFLLMALNSFAHLFTHSFFQQWFMKIYYVLILLRIVKFCLLYCKMFFLVHSLPFNFVYGRLWCIEILNFYALIIFVIFCNMLRNSFSILRESFIIWIEKPCFKKSLRSEMKKKYIYI